MQSQRRRCVLLLALMVVMWGRTAAAQPIAQGRVIRDSAIIWRTDSSVPLATVQNGDVLEVTGQSSRWFEVRLPERIGGLGAIGLIARTQLQLQPESPAPPMKTLRGDPPPSPPQNAGATSRAQPAVRRRPRSFPLGFLAVNAARQTRVDGFEQVSTLEANAEEGEIRTQYSAPDAWGLHVAITQKVAGALALGGAVEAFTRKTPGSLTASVPHPFFFGTPRVVSRDVDDLDQTQVGLHFQARGLWFIGSHLHLSAGGGPSLFYVKQALITDINYTEEYPYDTVTLERVDTSKADAWHLGFNVTSDVAYYLTRRVGVGIGAQYSRAEMTIQGRDGPSVDVQAGGLTVSAGLRFRF